jgi:hypothetical protein
MADRNVWKSPPHWAADAGEASSKAGINKAKNLIMNTTRVAPGEIITL